MKFYSFVQNNSFGVFENNDTCAALTIVEAESAEAANEKAFGGLLTNERGNCPCCGDRWRKVGEDDAEEFPHFFGKHISESCRLDDSVVIHYADGRVVHIRLGEEIPGKDGGK